MRKRKPHPCGPMLSEERRLLEGMNNKLARMESKLDHVTRGAVRQGAMAGGAAGGLAGAIVSLSVLFVKLRHGL
ncbi:hypothetical protein [Serratia fonticola]|uniref:hypothetical protein n=1 Tax=Serratia fonticola TaxID=47917 RepID=UPI00301D191E